MGRALRWRGATECAIVTRVFCPNGTVSQLQMHPCGAKEHRIEITCFDRWDKEVVPASVRPVYETWARRIYARQLKPAIGHARWRIAGAVLQKLHDQVRNEEERHVQPGRE